MCAELSIDGRDAGSIGALAAAIGGWWRIRWLDGYDHGQLCAQAAWNDPCCLCPVDTDATRKACAFVDVARPEDEAWGDYAWRTAEGDAGALDAQDSAAAGGAPGGTAGGEG